GRAREHDEGEHRNLRRLEPRDLAAGVGKVVRGGRFELAGRRYAVRGVAGHHLVVSGGMIEQTGRRVAHGADERGLVYLLSELRHDFTEPDAWHIRFYLLELAAHVRRRVRFRVPDVDVARSALQEDEENLFSLAP